MFKKIGILTGLLLLVNVFVFGQEADCPTCPDNGAVDNTQYDVIRTKDKVFRGEFVPNEILIKLKDDVRAVLGKSTKGYAITGVASIDAIFTQYKVTSAEKLFKNAKRLTKVETFTTFNGYTFTRPSLHNIDKLVVEEGTDIREVIEALKNNDSVEYAEPNYIFSIVADKPVSPELNETEMKEWLKNHPEVNSANNTKLNTTSNPNNSEQVYGKKNKTELVTAQKSVAVMPTNDALANNASPNGALQNDNLYKINTVTPNDPLYSQQWGIPACQIDAVWDSTTGDTTQVIAILDTGVDWLHPDLKNNIWTNSGEIPGNGIDDDGDGFVDDVRGWDFINHDNNPTDDNSHGTHVAGIAAAEGNNGIGIAGVNWHAKIMPIKVFQSSGRGDVATITQGIIYAATHGATVINMSFGSYARSLTMEAALKNAYANSVLVAAAGNDDISIGPPPPRQARPFYPAALSYVLGVQATRHNLNITAKGFKKNTYLTDFTNYDQDGPVFSKYPNLLNYEMKTPGNGIISTIPNGNYRVYSGTSMAAPLLSGAVSLYKTKYPLDSQELMWGNLINTTTGHLKLFDAINVKAKPQLWFVSQNIVDTLNGDNNNSLVDAGETIQLWFKIRNTWGQSDSVFVGLKFGEFEDTTAVQILKDTSFIGSISPYATRTNETNPLLIHISPNIANNRNIVLEGLLWYKSSPDTVKQKIVLTASHGTYLSGVMDSTMVLTPNYLWIVNSSFRVGSNGYLKILPGTKIITNKMLNNKGTIDAIGKPDSLIYISGYGGLTGPGVFNLKYCIFKDYSIGNSWGGTYNYDHCYFRNIKGTIANFQSSVILSDSDIRNSNVQLAYATHNLTMYRTNIGGGNVGVATYFNWMSIKFSNLTHLKSGFGIINDNVKSGFNNLISNKNSLNIFTASYNYWANSDIINFQNQYWGTADPKIIKSKMYDFFSDALLPQINFTPFLTQPSDSAHGIVWKVLVDGIDPQDQANLMNPIGVGPHRFDVYFNRPMDTKYTPHLTFGVRAPYTQQSVTDSSFWSPDSMIWTAYKTIKLYTGDGINRIRVADARDPEDFVIPIEDMRYEFLIDAAGLSSVDFNSTAGLGKIKLKWLKPNSNDVPDLLGYNMYRFTNLTDTTYSDTTLLNKDLITDTTYTDFDVIPGNRYYYLYKVVRTNFKESDYSHVTSATALTASAGDANGDLKVDVLDIVTDVSYILNNNPQPFIFDAADINSDSTINVLDIVGTVNIILHPSPAISNPNKTNTGSASIDLTNNELKLNTNEPVAAIQLKINGSGLNNLQFAASTVLNGFEIANGTENDSSKIYLFFNINGNVLPKGNYSLGSFSGASSVLSISDVIIADTTGINIVTDVKNNGKSIIPEKYYLDQNYPNPFNPETIIQFGIPKTDIVKIVIYNILGQRIKTFDLGEKTPGNYKVRWNGRTTGGFRAASGVYIYRIETQRFFLAKKMVLLR